MAFLTSIDYYYMEPLDQITRNAIANYVKAFIDRTYEAPNHGGGLFNVICNEDNNPPSVVNEGGIVCRVDLTIQSVFRLPDAVYSFEFGYYPIAGLNTTLSKEYIEWVKDKIRLDASKQ